MSAAFEKGNNLGVTSVKSVSSYLEIEDHVLDLQAVISNPLAIGDVGVGLTSSQKYAILRRLNFWGLKSLESLPPTAIFMIEKIEALPLAESVDIIREAISTYAGDPNIPHQDFDLFQRLVDTPPDDLNNAHQTKHNLSSAFEKEKETHFENSSSINLDPDLESKADSYLIISDWSLQVRLEAGLIAYFSPYPEVRSVCDPFDDPSIACETWRVYILGLIWTAIGTFINQFFSERQPSISLSTSVVQLFLYPCGMLLSKITPKKKVKIWKYEIDLNPGPWTYKEQMLTTIFFSVSASPAYVSWNIHVQKMAKYYDNDWITFGYQTLLILSTNFMGFGFAGIMRKFAVYPMRAIWPTLLPTLALNRALLTPESKENINGWTISRYYFFLITTAGSFVYFWLPNYLFQALSSFNWITWIAPNNFNLAMITGTFSGLGMNPIPSFDWNVLNYNYALNIPFYSQANQYVGSIIGFFCIIGVYYSNYYWTSYLPINSNALFTNTGEPYSVRAVVNSNSLFDNAKYQQVGLPFYTAANLVSYGAFFALYPFAFVYEIISSWKPILFGFKSLGASFKNFHRSTYEGYNDPHSRMMSRYKEVPDWAFLVILIISVVLAILCVKLFPAQTPVWAIFFALGINFVFLIPLTSIAATTGFSFGLNVLVELIIGYAIPGNGLALMFVKALGYNIDGQASNYITDQKMGHYAKIPPRAMFRCQLISVFVASFIGLGVMNFQMSSIENYCSATQPQKFTCPSANTYYSASVIWGVIGPKKVFDGLYPILKYCFLIGALAGLLCAAIKIYGPKKYFNAFQPTLIIGGFIIYAPYNLSYYTGSLYLWSMWYLKNKYPAFWEKYNYVFSGAMSAGVAFSSIIIFFAVQYHAKDVNWWGNSVFAAGIDYNGATLRNATAEAPDGYFGPRLGHFP